MKMSFNSSSGSGTGCAGKGFGTLFFGIFFLMGTLFTVFILGETIRQLAPWSWPEVDCTILSSEVGETGDDSQPYRPVVRFRYEAAGRTYENDDLTRGDDGTSSYDEARDYAAEYPPDTVTTCRVNPDDPSTAVLEQQIPWIAFVVFFPLIFVAIGGGGLYAVWRSSVSDGDTTIESISQNAPSRRGYLFLVVFGLIFVVVGCAVFIPLAGLPALRLARSATWDSTPCTIVGSRMRSWSTDDGTSYRADILYEYRAGGQSWRSNRVDFFGSLSSGADSARETLERFPEGAAAVCWVDPRSPNHSVLDREVHPKFLLGLLPLVFIVAGLAVAGHGWRMSRRQQTSQEFVPEIPAEADGSLLLEPDVGPVGKAAGAVFFSIIWNGLVSVFVWQAWKTWDSGHPDWFLTIFLVPFVLVGLASVGFIVHSLLALANPRPRVTLTPGNPRLGDSIHLEWQFAGRATRIEHLRVSLEGHEEATYRRGTDTITEEEVFASYDLVNTVNDWEIPRGTAEFTIPADTMHSFEATSNKIVWEFTIEGEIGRWPDVDQNFAIQIRPQRAGDVT